MKSHTIRIIGRGGGLVHPIVTIGRGHCIMKTRTQMASIHTDPVNNPDNSNKTEAEKEEEPIDQTLIKWEEWALSAEEHWHALTKFRDNPKGRPMGHKA